METPSSPHRTMGLILLVAACAIPLLILAIGPGQFSEDAAPAHQRRPADDAFGSEASAVGTAPEASATAIPAGPSHESGYPMAPDFERPALNGRSLQLSTLRGQVVVLNFWATWCIPCRVEIPGFLNLRQELGSKGLEFVGVSLDEEGFEVVRPFAEELAITYPLVIGDEAVADAYDGILGLPTTYVLDRDGRIRQRFVGMVAEETLRAVLVRLLREEPRADE